MMLVPDGVSVPASWRPLTAPLPPSEKWHDIAASPHDSALRSAYPGASTAFQLVANLTDAPGLRESYRSLRTPSRSRLLDAACGPGVTSRIAAASGHRVTAVDNDPAMLEIAQAGPRGDTIRFVEADLRRDLPWPDGHFTTIVVGDWWDEAFLPELLRILHSDGTLWVRLSNIRQPTLYTHDLGFDARMWDALTVGYQRHFGDAGQATLDSLHAAGFQHSHDVRVVHDLRRQIVAYRQALSFTLWESRFVQETLSIDDWHFALALWNPTNERAWWAIAPEAPITWLSHWKRGRG